MQKNFADYQKNLAITDSIVSSSIRTPYTLNNINALQTYSMMNAYQNQFNPYLMNPYFAYPQANYYQTPYQQINPYLLYQQTNPWLQANTGIWPQAGVYNPWMTYGNPYINPVAQPGIVGPWQQQAPLGFPGNQTINSGTLTTPGLFGPNPFIRF